MLIAFFYVTIQESAVDFTEIEEALVLVKQKKQKLQAHPDFLQKVDEEFEKGKVFLLFR